MVISVNKFSLSFASRTQATVATSSGEAEILALSSTLHECCAIRNILVECGLCQLIKIHLMTDASTGYQWCNRFGYGQRTRHVDIRYLAIQNLVNAGIVTVLKIEGKANPADLLTKSVALCVLTELRHRHRAPDQLRKPVTGIRHLQGTTRSRN